MTLTLTYNASLIAAEPAVVHLPKNYRGDATVPGVIALHGFGGTALEFTLQDSTRIAAYLMVKRLVEAGFPVVTPLAGGDAWGNPTAVSRIASARTYLQGSLGAKAGKVILLGHSMGHVAAVNYAVANPTLVSSIISSMGVCDLSDLHASAAYTASINAAYGGTWTQATNGPTSNPLTQAQAGKLAGIPWLGYYGDADAVCTPAKAETFRAAIGASARRVLVPGGHAFGTIASYNHTDIQTFARQYA